MWSIKCVWVNTRPKWILMIRSQCYPLKGVWLHTHSRKVTYLLTRVITFCRCCCSCVDAFSSWIARLIASTVCHCFKTSSHNAQRAFDTSLQTKVYLTVKFILWSISPEDVTFSCTSWWILHPVGSYLCDTVRSGGSIRRWRRWSLK